jgi:hypothetical protein
MLRNPSLRSVRDVSTPVGHPERSKDLAFSPFTGI